MFREHDVVVLREIRADASRTFDGTPGVRREPAAGDVGAIVHVLDPEWYVVESVDAEGRTVWLGDFAITELVAFPEGWRFEVTETSAGVYLAVGHGPKGQRVEITDVEPERALSGCRAWAVGQA